VQAWIRTSALDPMGILVKSPPILHEPGDKLLGLNHTASKIGLDHGWVGYLAGVTSINDATWHQVTWTQQRDVSGSQERWILYVDGMEESRLNISTSADISTHTLRVGGRSPGSYFDGFFDGSIDEVQIQNIAITPAWITTAFCNQSAPASFVRVGTEEVLGSR